MKDWTCALALDANRRVVDGDARELADAIRRGADLRILTEFRHNEHIDVTSDSDELVREVAEFAVTYLIDRRWTAGIMSLRQPVQLPTGLGPRPSMSYFLYNENGEQAIARLHIDGSPVAGDPGLSVEAAPEGMVKYHAHDFWDRDTNAPSHNFVYDFDLYRYYVCDRWEEVLAHYPDGSVSSGSVGALGDAFARGCSVKTAVTGLCADLSEGYQAPEHELFTLTGSGYHYTESNVFVAGSHPVVRVRPGIPMRYGSHGWDSGWLVLRSDGAVVYRRCDPYKLTWEDRRYRCAMRWFVSGS
ncbi:MAG: hypothetical protein VX733_01415 [Candidatus Latescibacterota bacterium]|nr:hypothetical protein [Candidatus Latescibacterota bacterium]